ncbi:MAG: DotU family type IV/VI secretion system protein [Terriglobia bacterium]
MSEDPTNVAATSGADLRPALRRTNLALVYQEILTVISRLRANRQAVMDAASFRRSMKAALAAAEADATRKGYTPEDARLATLAVVALLDESAGNANDPILADWARTPVEEEMFGEHTSGEIFFECVDRLLARGDSPQDADVLEVFALCLLLGYRGRYRASEQGDVRPIIATIVEKVQRIRGPRRLAPDGAPPQDAVLRPPQDPWVRALIFGTLGALFLAVLFFVGFKVALLSGASGLHSIGPLAPE